MYKKKIGKLVSVQYVRSTGHDLMQAFCNTHSGFGVEKTDNQA